MILEVRLQFKKLLSQINPCVFHLTQSNLLILQLEVMIQTAIQKLFIKIILVQLPILTIPQQEDNLSQDLSIELFESLTMIQAEAKRSIMLKECKS